MLSVTANDASSSSSRTIATDACPPRSLTKCIIFPTTANTAAAASACGHRCALTTSIRTGWIRMSGLLPQCVFARARVCGCACPLYWFHEVTVVMEVAQSWANHLSSDYRVTRHSRGEGSF